MEYFSFYVLRHAWWLYRHKIFQMSFIILFSFINKIVVLIQINDLKDARRLASEITVKGAQLYDMLGKEVDLRVCYNIFDLLIPNWFIIFLDSTVCLVWKPCIALCLMCWICFLYIYIFLEQQWRKKRNFL